MKNLKLFFEFFNHNILKIVAVTLIMISSMIIMSTTIGNYRYYKYSLDFFSKEELNNAVVTQIFWSFQDKFRGEYSDKFESKNEFYEAYNKAMEDVFKQNSTEKTKSFSAVKNVYKFPYTSCTYNNVGCHINFSDEDNYKVFNYPLSSGCWFYDCEQTSEYPNAVLCGDMYQNVSVGSDITIQMSLEDNQLYDIKLHIIGKVKPPYYTLKFHQAASSEDSFMLTNSGISTSTIFLVDNDYTKNAFPKDIEDYINYSENFLVSFKDTASQSEIDEYLTYISQFADNSSSSSYPAYLNLNKIIENNNSYISQKLNLSLPLSIFYLVVATFTLICVSVIIVRKKLPEHYIYYLCGCSRKKSFLLILSGIFSIGCVSSIIVSVYLFFVNFSIANGTVKCPDIYIDEYSYIYVWIYMLIITAITLFISFIIFRKNTPIELYRKQAD